MENMYIHTAGFAGCERRFSDTPGVDDGTFSVGSKIAVPKLVTPKSLDC